MLDKSKAQELFDRIQKFYTSGELEVIFSPTAHSLTRFANNTIQQNVAEINGVAPMRGAVDGKTARATTNRFDDESLKRDVRSAENIAKVQEPDSDRLPMAKAEEGRIANPPQRWFEMTTAITPADRAEAVGKIVEVAKRNKLVTAGIYSSTQAAEAVVNSNGLNAVHRQTAAQVSITMLADDSSGWQKANSPALTNLDPVRLAGTAAKKTRDSPSPPGVPPRQNTV